MSLEGGRVELVLKTVLGIPIISTRYTHVNTQALGGFCSSFTIDHLAEDIQLLQPGNRNFL